MQPCKPLWRSDAPDRLRIDDRWCPRGGDRGRPIVNQRSSEGPSDRSSPEPHLSTASAAPPCASAVRFCLTRRRGCAATAPRVSHASVLSIVSVREHRRAQPPMDPFPARAPDRSTPHPHAPAQNHLCSVRLPPPCQPEAEPPPHEKARATFRCRGPLAPCASRRRRATSCAPAPPARSPPDARRGSVPPPRR